MSDHRGTPPDIVKVHYNTRKTENGGLVGSSDALFSFSYSDSRGLAHSKMNLTPQFKHQTVAGNPEQCTDSSYLGNYLLMSIYSQLPCPPLAAIVQFTCSEDSFCGNRNHSAGLAWPMRASYSYTITACLQLAVYCVVA